MRVIFYEKYGILGLKLIEEGVGKNILWKIITEKAVPESTRTVRKMHQEEGAEAQVLLIRETVITEDR